MCMPKYKKSIRMQILGIVYRVSKAIVFNIFCVILGFILGYQFCANKEYLDFVQREDIDHIKKIHEIMKKHIELDKEMDQEFSELEKFLRK